MSIRFELIDSHQHNRLKVKDGMTHNKELETWEQQKYESQQGDQLHICLRDLLPGQQIVGVTFVKSMVVNLRDKFVSAATLFVVTKI